MSGAGSKGAGNQGEGEREGVASELAEVLKRTAELMKNEQGEDMLGPVMEEDDLKLMGEEGVAFEGVDFEGVNGELADADVGLAGRQGRDNFFSNEGVQEEDGDDEDDEDDEEDEEDDLLELMDGIEDAAMYEVMSRDRLEMAERDEKECMQFGGLKPGFLGGRVKKDVEEPRVGENVEKQGDVLKSAMKKPTVTMPPVLGEVRERKPVTGGGGRTMTGGTETKDTTDGTHGTDKTHRTDRTVMTATTETTISSATSPAVGEEGTGRRKPLSKFKQSLKR